jgi:hypothetical protein
MGSSKSRGRKNQRTHKSSRGPTQAQAQTQRSASLPAQPAPKVRGGWLTAMLIIIAIHAVFTAVLLISYHKDPGVTREVLWAGAILVALLEIASAVVMWFWKKWGLYLYVAATLASIGFGLVIYPSMLVAFHAIIPLGILAYILQAQNKLKLFE